ncbi:MAG: hypothetical protein PQJ50_13995 [Spirochaetales bacterium]|nr:hypothetical protein [Spirochaetales bacterium]
MLSNCVSIGIMLIYSIKKTFSVFYSNKMIGLPFKRKARPKGLPGRGLAFHSSASCLVIAGPLPILNRHHCRKHLKVGTEADKVKKNKVGMISYLALYVGGKTKMKAKEYQHHLPEEYTNVGRWWGIYGNRLKRRNTKVYELTEQEYIGKMFKFQDYWEKLIYLIIQKKQSA